eukprot:747564-Hanusia_phi.AAC.4
MIAATPRDSKAFKAEVFHAIIPMVHMILYESKDVQPWSDCHREGDIGFNMDVYRHHIPERICGTSNLCTEAIDHG